MKITMLGCGTSVGVPSLGILGWGKCNPDNPKNRRQRSSVLIQENGINILIDAGPDVRKQLLDTKIEKIDAVLITHTHSDHAASIVHFRNNNVLIIWSIVILLTVSTNLSFLHRTAYQVNFNVFIR